MRPSHRVALAANQGIRGGAEKTLGPFLAKAFHAPLLDFSSGDLPKCLGHGRFPEIDNAVREFPSDVMAYDHRAYNDAQGSVLGFLGGNPEAERIRAQVIGGISPVMSPLVRYTTYALGYDEGIIGSRVPAFVICPPVHPNWLSAVVENFGYGALRTIKRGKDGNPDLEDAARVFRSLNRPFVVISTPDENPSGVCTPNSYYHNPEGTGILDLVRNVPFWGMWIWDAIYSDLSWGPNAGKRAELRQAAEELGIRSIILHSLSKVYMKPGLRIGGAYYSGPLDHVGQPFCTMFNTFADANIKNGISGPSLGALRIAYGNLPKIEQDRVGVVEDVRRHVTSNQAFLSERGLPHLFPGVSVDSAFYGLQLVPGWSGNGTKVPWSDPTYRQWLIDRIDAKVQALGTSTERLTWQGFRTFVGEHGISASRALALELAMNGLMVLPRDPFYPVFKEASDGGLDRYENIPRRADGSEALVVRLILAHPPETMVAAADVIQKVWTEAVSAFSGHNWKLRYS